MRRSGFSEARIEAMRAAFVARYPKIFKPHDAVKVPLAIGIRRDLINEMPECDPDLIGLTLAVYCDRPLYQKALAAGGSRYALDGSESGRVSEAERDRAIAWLAILHDAQAARKSRAAAIVDLGSPEAGHG